MFLNKSLPVNAFFKCMFVIVRDKSNTTSCTCSIPSILWDIILFSPSPWSVCVCAQCHFCPNENRWGGVLRAPFFIPYHLHFREGQLQHTTNILFLAKKKNTRKWMFIVGPSWGGQDEMRNVVLISCFPFLEERNLAFGLSPLIYAHMRKRTSSHKCVWKAHLISKQAEG